MSEKQNYDKILLASGIVLGLGVAVYGTVTLLGLNDKYKFTTQVSEKAIDLLPASRKPRKSIRSFPPPMSSSPLRRKRSSTWAS